LPLPLSDVKLNIVLILQLIHVSWRFVVTLRLFSKILTLILRKRLRFLLYSYCL
jgi:hypothetical protein